MGRDRGLAWKEVWMLGVLAISILQANATTSFSQLPDISQLTPYAVFGNQEEFHNVTVDGNVGVSASGSLGVAAPATINGNLCLGVGAISTRGGTVTGTTFTGIDLTTPQNQVFSASSTFAGFTPDFSSAGNVSGTHTFGAVNGMADVYVININGNLTVGNNQAINFVGDPGDVFVLNISGNLSMNAHGRIGTAGQADMTLINLRGMGNLGTIADPNDVINGTLVIPNATSAALHGASGAIYSGNGQVTLDSGATINLVPFVPEPSTILAGALLLLPLGASALRIRRKSPHLLNSRPGTPASSLYALARQKC